MQKSIESIFKTTYESLAGAARAVIIQIVQVKKVQIYFWNLYSGSESYYL